MKLSSKLLFVIVLLLFLASCSPSGQAIQETPTPTQMIQETSTETQVPLPTKTKIPSPTATKIFGIDTEIKFGNVYYRVVDTNIDESSDIFYVILLARGDFDKDWWSDLLYQSGSISACGHRDYVSTVETNGLHWRLSWPIPTCKSYEAFIFHCCSVDDDIALAPFFE